MEWSSMGNWLTRQYVWCTTFERRVSWAQLKLQWPRTYKRRLAEKPGIRCWSITPAVSISSLATVSPWLSPPKWTAVLETRCSWVTSSWTRWKWCKFTWRINFTTWDIAVAGLGECVHISGCMDMRRPCSLRGKGIRSTRDDSCPGW